MKDTTLTVVETPSGNMAFKEARLIIECKLLVLSTVLPDDLCAQEAIDFVAEEYKDKEHYRKIAYSEITKAWIKN